MFFAALLLVSPAQSYVICIAPGGHIAIEDINATCCLASNILSQRDQYSDSGLGTAGDCHNCTDISIYQIVSGAISRSTNAAGGPLTSASFGQDFRILAFSRLFLQAGPIGFVSNSAFPSVPLRC